MDKKRPWLRFYLPLVMIFTLSAAAVRSVALLRDYNFAEGFFEDPWLSGIGATLIFAAAAISLTYLFIKETDRGLIPSFSGGLSFIPAGAVSVALVFFTVGNLIGADTPGEGSAVNKLVDTLEVACPILALLAIGAFVTSVIITERQSNLRAYFGMVAVLFFTLYGVLLFFDSSRMMNSEARISDEFASVLCAVAMLFEVRLSLGRDAWRAYVSFALVAAAVAGYSSIPSIAVYLVSGELISRSIYESALFLAMSVYLFARLIKVLTLEGDYECSIVTAIKNKYAVPEEQKENLDAGIDRAEGEAE